MISNPRHGSPPRLMAHQPTRCSTTQESSIRVHRPDPVLDEKWPADQPTEEVTYSYDFLHSGLIREVVARIGGEAGINALYWRGGVCFYETGTRSRALIE